MRDCAQCLSPPCPRIRSAASPPSLGGRTLPQSEVDCVRSAHNEPTATSAISIQSQEACRTRNTVRVTSTQDWQAISASPTPVQKIALGSSGGTSDSRPHHSCECNKQTFTAARACLAADGTRQCIPITINGLIAIDSLTAGNRAFSLAPQSPQVTKQVLARTTECSAAVSVNVRQGSVRTLKIFASLSAPAASSTSATSEWPRSAAK